MPDVNPRIWCARCGRPVEAIESVALDYGTSYKLTAICHGEKETHEYTSDFIFGNAAAINIQFGLAFDNRHADA